MRNARALGLAKPRRDVDANALIGQLPEALAVYDADTRLIACNRTFLETFSPEEREAVAPKPTTPGGRELLQRTRDGHWFLHQKKLTTEGDTLCTYQDVTALKSVETDLRMSLDGLRRALTDAQRARSEAESAAQGKIDFLVSMSHELRTPLNAILGFSEMLTQEIFGPLPNARYREYAQIIHDSGSHLLGLINDLLDMSKLDAGKLEMHFAPVDIGRLLIDCVHGVEAQARKSGIGLCIEMHNAVERFEGDEKRLRQMLLNLLSNAIKFTPEGGEVRITVFRRGESIGIAVSDTGIGMKEDDIPKVLEPFGQVDSPMARKHDGTGLGLPLTKELAEQHGGTLLLESTVDVGTTATILLPDGPHRAEKKAA
jgi:two-component system cell cycle sensor histidine kinase PleC